MPAAILSTERLTLRHIEPGDATFILQLVNTPDWLRFIGDRKINTLDQARDYIDKTAITMYRELGFGMYLVERNDDRQSLGLCGLVKRDMLEFVDLGFALLPEFSGRGYAFEAAEAMLDYSKRQLGIETVIAVTAEDNQRSVKLLERLGMTFEKRVRLFEDKPEVLLFR